MSMVARFLLLTSLGAALLAGCSGRGGSGPISENLEDLVIQQGELPPLYEQKRGEFIEDNRGYLVEYQAPDGNRIVTSIVRRMPSSKDAADYVNARNQEYLKEGFSLDRAKELGNINYFVSRITDNGIEYRAVVAENKYVSEMMVAGDKPVFGECYVYTRYVYHHLKSNAPTPDTGASIETGAD
jgi:hypothetical protein